MPINKVHKKFTIKNEKSPGKSLQFSGDYVIMFKVQQELTKRYALKRKVAGGMSGNFRGVCPILNRATRNDDTVCGA